MACRLSDVVVRRTGLGAAGKPSRLAVEACGRIAAAELGWDPARTATEVDAVEQFYATEP